MKANDLLKQNPLMTLSKILLSCGILGTLFLANPSVLKASPTSMCDAVVGNLVKNCGFESASFAPSWSYGGPNGAQITTSSHSGVYSAQFTINPVNGASFDLFQEIPTTVGATYDLSFWIANDTCSPGSCGFSVNWNHSPVPLFTSSPTASSDYTQFFFVGLPATLTSTSLHFYFKSIQSNLYFDDVVLTPAASPASVTPEPASLMLFGTGLVGLGFKLRRQLSKSSQLQ